MDLYGNFADLFNLAQATGFKYEKDNPEQFEPRVGILYVPRENADPLKVEILQHVYGINSQNIENDSLIAKADYGTVRVLHPFALLKAKQENAVNLPQNDPDRKPRQDVRHLKIVKLCVRAHLRESIRAVHANLLPARNCLDRLETAIALVKTDIAKRAASLYQINWQKSLPLAELYAVQEPRLKKFANLRLPRVLEEIGTVEKPASKLREFIRSHSPARPEKSNLIRKDHGPEIGD
ncbi:MAG: hypothetical protein PHV34_19035 [Verrucomicrobiae bacterium]|nr:hypothetical protein [Verrucomicrobiae bacterium]